MLRKPNRLTAAMLICLSSIALPSCATKPLRVQPEKPICPAPPKAPKAATDPVEVPSFLSGRS